MKRLFIIDDSLTNKISYCHIILFLISLPFDRFYSVIIFLSFAIHTLIHLKKKYFTASIDKRILLLQSVYFIALLGTIYTPTRNLAFAELTKKLAILILPLIFYFNPIDLDKYKKRLMLFFSLGCTLAITYLYADALQIIYYDHLPLSTLVSSLFINQNFSEAIGMHATFLSMYAALSFVFILTELTTPLTITRKIFYILILLILSAGLLQLCSKSVFFACLLIINLAFPYFVLKGKNRIKYLVISSSVSIIILLLIIKIDTFHTRYFTDLSFDLQKNSDRRITDSRMERWHTAIDLIKKKPLIGYGTGSEIPLLKEQYFNNKQYSAYLHGLNAHNQYLSFLIKTGLIGLGIYLFTLFAGFKQALKSRDILFISFMLLISVISLSENLLDVNKGIFFYSIFFTLFTFSDSLKKQSKIR